MTLRELQAMVFDKRALALCAAAAFVCTIAAPFDTDSAPIFIRAIYWTVSIFMALVISSAIIPMAHRVSWLEPAPEWVKSPIGAVVFAAVYAGLLTILTLIFFGNAPNIPGYLDLFGYAAPIAVAVSIIIDLFRPGNLPPAAAPSPSDRFFKRLKPALGRDLICLSMQDHYVEVKTALGAQLVLMRFSDALAELADQPGWRIHRSHWVAEAGMADIRRDGGKTFVVTSDGEALPVSRTYLPALRDAGVLKRFT